MLRRTLAATVSLAIAAAAAPAMAQDAGDAVELDYQAPAGCPGAREFSWRVSARTPRARAPRPGETPRRFTVRVEVTAGRALGHLTIREPDGVQSERTLAVPSCAEVVDALALVVALAIDPRASTEPLPAPAPLPKPAPTPRRAHVARKPPPRLHLEAAVHALVAHGLAPEAMLATGMGVGAVFLTGGWLEPALGASYLHAPRQTFDVRGGTARFSWDVGVFWLCPLAAHVGKLVALRYCGALEWGELRAAGSSVSDPHAFARRWLAPGAMLAVDVTPTEPLLLRLGLSGVFPADRDRYFVGSTVVHAIPPVALRAGLSVGARLP
jgi:hypothetical protein